MIPALRHLRLLSMLLAVAIVMLAGGLHAQTWPQGVTLAMVDAQATTGTLQLRTAAAERTYDVLPIGTKLSLKTLKLSGDFEIPMKLTGTGRLSHRYDVAGNEVVIGSTDPKSILVEFHSKGQNSALAILQVSSDDSLTSMTGLLDLSGQQFETSKGTLYIQNAGTRAYQKTAPKSVQYLAPLEADNDIRISISTEKKTAAQIMAMKFE